MSRSPSLQPRAHLRLCTLLLACLAAAWSSAQVPVAEAWPTAAIRDSFARVHAHIDAAVASGSRDEEVIRGRLTRLVDAVLASGIPRAQADVINEALGVANRLDSRHEVLQALSAAGYRLDLSGAQQQDLTPLLFTLGNLEKANGDLQAAQLWFDSTAALLHGRHTPLYVAAAAKLSGGIDREQGRPAAALTKLRLAKSVLDTTEAQAFEAPHLDSELALAIVDAGAGLDEALALSSAAYATMVGDAAVRDSWTYSYLVYLNHAGVLHAAGRTRDGLRVMREALALVEARGDRPSEGYIRMRMARHQLALGDLAGTERSALAALAIFEDLRHDSHLAEAHGYLRQVYAATPATLRKSLDHAEEAHRIELALLEADRAESLLALRNDHRRESAEQRAVIATQAAERAELESARVQAQRTTLLLAVVFIAGVLAFVAYRLRARHRLNAQLEVLVTQRTAELAERTAQLEERTRKLQASNHELERFAFIASHDLKTPLRNVTSFLGLIERRMPAEARAAVGEYVQLAIGYAKKMHMLVSDVLEFSQLNDCDDDAPAEVCDLRALCETLATDYAATAVGAQVTVLGAARTAAPQRLVRQVLTNLLDNALKFNESTVKRVAFELAPAGSGGGVCVRVRDNGIGIAPEYHDYVFELFRRLHTDDVYAGTGLGLASCAKLVERMGGTLTLDSALGRGSTFCVQLPASVPAGETSVPERRVLA